MKLALAHEYFAARGGAERVVDVFHAMWPEAPVYTFFHDRRRYGDLTGWDLRTSYLQQFVEKLTQLNRGRAFFTTPETLGDYVLVDFIEQRRQMSTARRRRAS